MEYNEALYELKEMDLVTYDDDGNEIDCQRLKDFVPSLIEPIEDALKVLDIIQNNKEINTSK